MYWLSNLCRCRLMFFGSAEPHLYFIDCFVCSLLNIKLVFRYQINFFCIPLLFSVCSKVVNLIHLFNQIVFQIYFPLTYPLTYPINDRDVNCCLDVYSSREFAVCLLVLKIIFVIEIIFSNFYCSLNFYIYLSVVLVNIHIASNYQIVLKSVTYKFHYQNHF